MVEIKIAYQGQLRCKAEHQPSGTTLVTDAPVDNQGKGESFSPTDLVATALGACMLTIMGIVAERDGLDLSDASVKVLKEMTPPPRRIGKLTVEITVPSPLSIEQQNKLRTAAMTCPVHRSLHPDVQCEINFQFQPLAV